MKYMTIVGWFAAACVATATTVEAQTLEGFAVLPADTFAPGPTSGQFISPSNGSVPPYVDRQPVQGVSSVLPTQGGGYLVMSDNGFGSQPTSADYVLRVYRIGTDFRTRQGGAGTIAVESYITLQRSGSPHRLSDCC